MNFIRSDFVFPYKGVIKIDFDKRTNFKMMTNGSDTIAASLKQDGIEGFEPEVVAIFKSLIEKSNTFLDVGANTGFYTLLASTIKPTCTIHAFEPVPSIFNSLEANINLNKLQKATPHLLALSNETKKSSFFVPKSIRISTGASQVAQFQDCEEIHCQLIRLDDFVSQKEIQNIDFMKIDTETTEPLVLEGGLQTISKFRPFIIVEILNERVGSQVEQIISPLNYKYFQILPGKLLPLQSLASDISRGTNWNFLLVPQEKAEDFKS